MKRILVIDESTAVRETLELLLGQEFEVAQRQEPSLQGLPSDARDFDLLILGLPPGSGEPSAVLAHFASRLPCPVLLLLETKPRLLVDNKGADGGWLTKPFNPYDLRAMVSSLLDNAHGRGARRGLPPSERPALDRYLEYPYLPQPVSELARRCRAWPYPLLLMGEAGCGQEQVLRAIHAETPEAGPWVSVHVPEIRNAVEGLGRRVQSACLGAEEPGRATLVLLGVEALDFQDQGALLRYLRQEEDSGRELWLLSTAGVDLLEQVYQGNFLDSLYYRLATLTLRIPPLRERPSDIPPLAAAIAGECARQLNLGSVSFSPDALDRLRHYLWFGNILELQSVITRTLVIRRKDLVEASDLIWDSGGTAPELPEPIVGEASAAVPVESPGWGNGKLPELRVLINELAHELKNPMVTIKTFAQLLAERFDDSAFRDQFQQRVGVDIARMDDVLELLVDFSRFSEPNAQGVSLRGQLQRTFEELVPECVERDASIRWGKREEDIKVFVDPEQFRYTLINVLRAVLGQIKAKGEIKVDIGRDGLVSMSYVREGSGTNPLSAYLEPSSQSREDEALPLRVLLAKSLLERSGGDLVLSRQGDGQMQIRLVVPTNPPISQ